MFVYRTLKRLESLDVCIPDIEEVRELGCCILDIEEVRELGCLYTGH